MDGAPAWNSCDPPLADENVANGAIRLPSDPCLAQAVLAWDSEVSNAQHEILHDPVDADDVAGGVVGGLIDSALSNPRTFLQLLKGFSVRGFLAGLVGKAYISMLHQDFDLIRAELKADKNYKTRAASCPIGKTP
jgi:hypothetical protein